MKRLKSFAIRCFNSEEDANTYAGKLKAGTYEVEQYYSDYYNYSDSNGGDAAKVWIVVGKQI
jgi:hypothetical protein